MAPYLTVMCFLSLARLADRPSEPDSLLVHLDELPALLGGGIGKRTIQRWVEQGDFPPPIRLGGRTIWRRADIELYVEAGGNMAVWQRLMQR